MTTSSAPLSRRRSARLLDAVVVGGGMVGAAAALALGRAGLAVSLVEAREPRPWQPADEVDLRVVALAPSSARLLQELGVWEAIRDVRAQPYRHMRVWDAANGAELDFDAAHEGRQALGWIVENRLIQHCLWQALASAGVERYCPASVSRFDAADDHVHLALADGQTLDARVLVAADGAASPLRQQAGIATHGHAYGQRAVVAHVTTEKPHADTAWQRFLPGGPIALLPLADGRSSIVWTLPEAEAARVQALDDGAFADAVGVASDFRLGRITGTTPRASFPLKLQLATSYQSGRLVLTGDAAHVVHPLAGQGVNLGLRDVAELRDAMLAAHEAGRDVGNTATLRRYARRRHADATLDARGIDLLGHAFGVKAKPLAALRGLGVATIDASPLKQLLNTRAAG
ncbi:MAG TPA: UbiH/UbiF/VisC/COQ6 family ubiquinone biosynthesis hydroxylase [Rhodanobacteraceae bacterium]